MKQTIYRTAPEERQKVLQRLTGVVGRRADVLFAYVYGSFTEDLPFHDIDIGVYLLNVEEEAALLYAVELSGELEREVRFPVDVRVLNFASIPFLYHVLRGKMLFERDESARARVVEETIRKYLDIKPLIRQGIKEAFAA